MQKCCHHTRIHFIINFSVVIMLLFMWKHAQGQLPDIDLLNGEYSMKWFNCSQIPRSLESEVDEEAINIDVEVEDTMETEDDDGDQYFRSFLSIKYLTY